VPIEPEIQPALEATVAYLGSAQAVETIRADPYWPKWDCPWWRMTLLLEMGHADLIPAPAVEAMVAALNTHYLPDFPQAHELPPGKDGYRHIICHCAVGTMFQVLHACGVNVDHRVPWMRPWLHRYQLPDGGLNCDERVYVKQGGKSSIVSTLPALEALLRCTPRPWPEDTARFLERGARYLIRHRLVRRASGDGGVIDPAWLQPAFPRFYFYDALRGLSFLTEWAEAAGQELPRTAVEESLELLGRRQNQDGGIRVARRAAGGDEGTVEQTTGGWKFTKPARSFALLDAVSWPGRVSPELGAAFERVQKRLQQLRNRGLYM
jgi:hypothetical protein